MAAPICTLPLACLSGRCMGYSLSRFAEVFFNKIDKMDSKIGFEMSLIVVEAMRGRFVEFHDCNGNGFRDIGGQTNSLF